MTQQIFASPSGVVANPPTYISVAQLKSMALDYSLTSYTDQQLLDILCRASGVADAMMKRSLLCTEKTEMLYGNGSNILELGVAPIAYVRLMQFVQPGIAGFIIPLNRVLVDGLKGEIVQYSPLELQGIGYVSIFPLDLPIAVTYGVGYGYNPITSPAWTSADAASGSTGLTIGTYTAALTVKTQWGESLPTYGQFTTATGSRIFTITPTIGAWKYAVYLAAGASTTISSSTLAGATTLALTAAGSFANGDTITLAGGTSLAENVTIVGGGGTTSLMISALVNAHASGSAVAPRCSLAYEVPGTTFGGEAMTQAVSSLTPPSGYYTTFAPIADTSALQPPYGIIEAVRLITLGILYEQNNLANRGVFLQDSGRKRISWKSTEGTSGRGIPLVYEQAAAFLKPYAFRGIY